MLSLSLGRGHDSQYNVLCLGAHSDDIEIGCGGTILKLKNEYKDLSVKWIVFSGEGERKNEAQTSADQFLEGVNKKKVEVLGFKDGYFPFQGVEIKNYFEQIKADFQPDLILTHYREDRHQDHRLLSDLTWNTFRNHLILEYEIPKYDGDLGNPNLFVALDEELCHRKVAYLKGSFKSQFSKNWFTEETFLSMLRIRGIECASQYAEAFHTRKLILQ